MKGQDLFPASCKRRERGRGGRRGGERRRGGEERKEKTKGREGEEGERKMKVK